MRELFLNLYRAFMIVIVRNLFLGKFLWAFLPKATQERLDARFRLPDSSLQEDSTGGKARKKIWFHAASVGELESIRTLATEWGEPIEWVLTCFSGSALGAIQNLSKELEEKGAKVRYAGFSPWEGEWGRALRTFRPTLFLTAKYEAWPELWTEAGFQAVPIAIVGAQWRRSLKIAQYFSRFLMGVLPELRFFAATVQDAESIKKHFKNSKVTVSGDPRWDRVFSRMQNGNARAQKLIELNRNLPRPWGIVGSAWVNDLEFLAPCLPRSGTLWVVPHQIDEENLEGIEEVLLGCRYKISRSSQQGAPTSSGSEKGQARAIVVDEMGFLLELYSSADWTFVGGGFGSGVHSTLEPALSGLPIAAGPKNHEKFPEISVLTQQGQLLIVEEEVQLRRWFAVRESQGSKAQEARDQWKETNRTRLGATQRVLKELKST